MHVAADLLLGKHAAEQHGVFTRAQALACGYSAKAIRHRLERGIWITLHPGVYCHATTAASWLRDEIAACFWSDGAAAGKAAGFLHQLPGCEDRDLEVVTHRRHRAMPRCGITVHVTKRLPLDQIVHINGIPVTSIERTLMDLCGGLTRRGSAIALDNALSRGLTGIGDLDNFLYRTARQGRNGCGRLRELLKERFNLGKFATTPLETVIFELIASSHLDMPLIQPEVRDEQGAIVAQPDFLYAAERLVIEGHSRLWHEGKAATDGDQARQKRLEALDHKVMYVTWADATVYGSRTIHRIENELAARRLLRAPKRPTGALS